MIDLEQTIADLVERKNKLPLDSAERRMINRTLTGLYYSCKGADGIIEDLDRDWGVIARPLAASPSTAPRQVLRLHKSGSRREPDRA
jgi:hypothetical protein